MITLTINDDFDDKVIDDCENSPTVLKKVIVLEISNLPSIPNDKELS